MNAVTGSNGLLQKLQEIARQNYIQDVVQKHYLKQADHLSLRLVDLLLSITPRHKVIDAVRDLHWSEATSAEFSTAPLDDLACQSKLAEAIANLVRLLVILEKSGLNHFYRFPKLGDHLDESWMEIEGARNASSVTVCLCYWPAICAKRKDTSERRVMMKARVSLM